MREVTIDCQLCGRRLPLDRGKEAFFETGNNRYHLMDLCASCLDGQLQRAESVNDTNGYRQNQAALIKLPDREVPSR